jgi:hypothetical protein
VTDLLRIAAPAATLAAAHFAIHVRRISEKLYAGLHVWFHREGGSGQRLVTVQRAGTARKSYGAMDADLDCSHMRARERLRAVQRCDAIGTQSAKVSTHALVMYSDRLLIEAVLSNIRSSGSYKLPRKGPKGSATVRFVREHLAEAESAARSSKKDA